MTGPSQQPAAQSPAPETVSVHGLSATMRVGTYARFGERAPHAERADQCTMVIFGATGDLTKRKLFPALYQLAAEHLLGPDFAVLAVGREASVDDASFRERMRAAVGESDEVKQGDEEVWKALAERIFFVGGDATDAAAYEGIKQKLDEIESACATEERNRFFYLAVPPSVFEPIVRLLSSSGLVPRIDDPAQRPWARVV